jgi:hypothetical protein
MHTLAEIKQAADALPAEKQELLLRHLSLKLAQRGGTASNPVPPPAVPKAELRRIHALIDAEFSRVDPEGW